LSSVKEEAKRLLGLVAQGIDIQGRKVAARQRVRQQATEQKAEQANSLRALVIDDYGPQRLDHQGRGGTEAVRLLREGTWADLWNRPLTSITGSEIARIVGKRRKEVSDWRARREADTLRAALNFAIEGGRLSASPMPKYRQLFGKLTSNARVRYLEPEERQRLEAALDHPRTPGRLRAITRLALHTGMRQGEIFKLRWRDVDLRAGRITVLSVNAKSKRERHIPLNTVALALLKTWRGPSDPPPDAFVFPGKDGAPLTDTKTAWRTLLERAGIESFRFHDCRHDFASQLVMKGVPLLEVGTLLGHADLTMTMRYAHLAPDHLKAAVEVLA